MSQPIQPTPQPQPTTPSGNPPQVPPRGPQITDPTGLRYDRGDLDETVAVPDGVELIAVGDRGRFDIPEVTAESCGLADDPIARILDLRARLEAEVEALSGEQYRELVQYGWPARGLRAVA